jgi:PBSX family phage terminase large subunit
MQKTFEFDFRDSKTFTTSFLKLWYKSQGKRFVNLYGGSGTGKSHAMAQMIIIKSIMERRITIVGRKVADTHKLSTVRLIFRILDDWGMIGECVKYYKSDHEFKFENGSLINFVGLDKIEKLKSIDGVKAFWFEETTEGTSEDFDEINRRLRGANDLQIFSTFNPIDIEHWIKRYFWDNEHFSNPKLSLNIHTHYSENPYLTDIDRANLEAMQSYNENDYRIYALGEWGQLKSGNEFYFKFEMKKHIRQYQYNPEHPLHISFDFNVVPYICCSVWQVVKIGERYECRCVDEITLKDPENNTFDLCKEVLNRYGKQRVTYLYGDATGRARSTQSKEHNWAIIQRQLAPMLSNYSDRVPASNPNVGRRREFVNRALHGSLIFDININQGCKLMIEDLLRVKTNAVGDEKLKVKTKEGDISFERWGHLSDTLDYFVCKLFENVFQNF